MKKATIILAGLAMFFAAATAHADGSIKWMVTGENGAIKHYDGSVLGFDSGSAEYMPWTIYLVLTDMKDDVTAAIESGTFNLLVNDLTLGSAVTLSGMILGDTPLATSSLLTVGDPPGAGIEYEYTVLYFNNEYKGEVGESGKYFFSGMNKMRAYTHTENQLENSLTETQVSFGPPYMGTTIPAVRGTWYDYAIVPEPSTAALLVLGVAALGSRRRARK